MRGKKLGFVAVLLLLTTGLGCNQFESFTSFTIEYEQEAKISSNVGINLPFNVMTPDMETNAEQRFENEDTKKEFIESIFLEELTLTIFDPEGEDFSFLEEISIFMRTDNLEEVMIASKKPVPSSSSNTLQLDCTEQDLQQYIKEESFTLRLNAVTDEILTRDHYFKINSRYGVSAKLKEE